MAGGGRARRGREREAGGGGESRWIGSHAPGLAANEARIWRLGWASAGRVLGAARTGAGRGGWLGEGGGEAYRGAGRGDGSDGGGVVIG